jgi:hypothetical protein
LAADEGRRIAGQPNAWLAAGRSCERSTQQRRPSFLDYLPADGMLAAVRPRDFGTPRSQLRAELTRGLSAFLALNRRGWSNLAAGGCLLISVEARRFSGRVAFAAERRRITPAPVNRPRPILPHSYST